MQFVAVVFIQSSFKIPFVDEFHNALIATIIVSIGISYFSGTSHHVFQILPRNFGRQVFHDHAEVGTCGRSILVYPRTSAIPAISTSTSVVTSRSSSMFNDYSGAKEITAIEFIDCIISIPIIIEFTKSVLSTLDENVAYTAVFFEKPFHVYFAGIKG